MTTAAEQNHVSPARDAYPAPQGTRVVWRASVFTGGETRWVRASYDTCAGVTIAWRCPDAGRPEGWYPVDTEPVTWIEDPDPIDRPHRRKCWLLVTRGGRPVKIAMPNSSP